MSTDTIDQAVKDFLTALDQALIVSKRETWTGQRTHSWQEEQKAWHAVHEARTRLEGFL